MPPLSYPIFCSSGICSALKLCFLNTTLNLWGFVWNVFVEEIPDSHSDFIPRVKKQLPIPISENPRARCNSSVCCLGQNIQVPRLAQQPKSNKQTKTKQKQKAHGNVYNNESRNSGQKVPSRRKSVQAKFIRRNGISPNVKSFFEW